LPELTNLQYITEMCRSIWRHGAIAQCKDSDSRRGSTIGTAL